jgi:SnoaL-like domain
MSGDADVMTDIEMLKAVEEIRQLEARYARYADERCWADLTGLFTVDGTFTPQDAGGKPMAVMSGRQEIADSLTAGVTPIYMLLTSEIEILSPATAHGIWAMADLIFRDDDPPAHSEATGNVPPFTTMRGWAATTSTTSRSTAPGTSARGSRPAPGRSSATRPGPPCAQGRSPIRCPGLTVRQPARYSESLRS